MTYDEMQTLLLPVTDEQKEMLRMAAEGGVHVVTHPDKRLEHGRYLMKIPGISGQLSVLGSDMVYRMLTSVLNHV